MIRKKIVSLLVACLALVLISGCATHSNKMDDAKTLMRYGEYTAAEQEMAEILKTDRDKLLKLVELGVLNQLKGDYQTSLAYLEEADKLADDLYTVSFNDLLIRASTNASLTTYRGNIVERVYINYFKMLNYFYLAEQAKTRQETENMLDSARIEARRAMILLDENVFKVGDYEVAEEEKESLLYKFQQIYAELNGEVINPKALIFRDNAFSHYLMATLFEKMGEKDSARISYERAAKLYEQGYVKQYSLSTEMVSQAWFDTARMLKANGDRRWRRIAANKLSLAQRQELKLSTKGKGLLVVVQEVDTIAPRGELNLWMTIEKDTLIIRPVPVGTPEQKAYQLAWFYYMYADKGLLNAVEKIKAKDYASLLNAKHEKKQSIPKALNSTLESLGLLQIMSSVGLRLSVPLLYYEDLSIGKSRLEVNGKSKGDLILADNISGLAMAQHLVSAGSELNNAMAVEALRLTLCIQAGAPAQICALATAASTAADTRSWLSLPYEIRTLRLHLPEGEHKLNLISNAQGFQVEQAEDIKIKAGEVKLVRMRTFAVDPNEELPESVKKARAATNIELVEVHEDKSAVDISGE